MNSTLNWFQPEISGLATTKNIRYDNGYVSLEYTCNGFWHDQRYSDKDSWDLIYIPECTNVATPGMPSLPMETVLIALPPGEFSSISIKVVDAIFKVVNGSFNVSPAPLEKQTNDQAPEFTYRPNAEIYASSSPYPRDIARPGTVRVLSGLRVASVVLSPIRYTPGENRLEYLERAHLQITYEEGPPLAAGGSFYSSSLFKQIQGSDSVRLVNEQPPVAGEPQRPLYLVVTSRALAPSLQPLLERRNSDFDCKTLYIDDFQVSPNSIQADIRKEIIRNFSSRPPNQRLGSLLIGGAHSVIPAYTYERVYPIGSTTFLSDHYYAEFSDDYYPIVSVGRLPASTPEDMSRMVAQTLSYENMSGEWQKKLWNCGYKEKMFDDQFIMPVKIINAMLHGHITVDWATFNVSNQNMLDEELKRFYTSINQGVAVVNYNGHGQVNAWQRSVAVSDLARIMPSGGLPVVICSACNNGMIDANDCFASAWLLEGKSVGVIAATSFSHVWINGEFDNSLIRAMANNELCLGDILNWAKTETLKNNMEDPNDKPLAVDNARMYLLLGDPALKLRAIFTL